MLRLCKFDCCADNLSIDSNYYNVYCEYIDLIEFDIGRIIYFFSILRYFYFYLLT